jgi:hypothetical protein
LRCGDIVNGRGGGVASAVRGTAPSLPTGHFPFTRCLDSSIGRVHAFDGGDPGSIPGGSIVYVGSPYCWQINFEICAHFAFLFQPEQMFFPFTLHGSANLILFDKTIMY